MIPLRDNIIARKLPIITVALIVLNMAVFVICALMPQGELNALLFQYGLIPAKIFRPRIVAYYYAQQFGYSVPVHYGWSESLLPMVTCMFLHGSVIHVVGNMWFLWIFGDNVEDCLGHAGFLLFYLACGLASSMVQTLSSPLSPVVTIGASGAVAGVMGAYLLLYPRARIMTLVWILFLVDVWPIPAFLYLFYWFAIQVLSGTASLGASGIAAGGVAWWAHIGGFIMGFGSIYFTGIRSPEKMIRPYTVRRLYFSPRAGRWISSSPRSSDED
jgi:hypothetical protein